MDNGRHRLVLVDGRLKLLAAQVIHDFNYFLVLVCQLSLRLLVLGLGRLLVGLDLA